MLEKMLEEIQTLSGVPLRSKAAAANSQDFVDTLRKQGLSMNEIEGVLRAFVRRFLATGQVPPQGGVFHLVKMAEREAAAFREGGGRRGVRG